MWEMNKMKRVEGAGVEKEGQRVVMHATDHPAKNTQISTNFLLLSNFGSVEGVQKHLVAHLPPHYILFFHQPSEGGAVEQSERWQGGEVSVDHYSYTMKGVGHTPVRACPSMSGILRMKRKMMK